MLLGRVVQELITFFLRRNYIERGTTDDSSLYFARKGDKKAMNRHQRASYYDSYRSIKSTLSLAAEPIHNLIALTPEGPLQPEVGLQQP